MHIFSSFFFFKINGQDENTSTQHLKVINHTNFKLDRNCLSLPDNKQRCEQIKEVKILLLTSTSALEGIFCPRTHTMYGANAYKDRGCQVCHNCFVLNITTLTLILKCHQEHH